MTNMKSLVVLLSLMAYTVAFPAPQGTGYIDPYGTQPPTFSDLNNSNNGYYGYTGNTMRIWPYVTGPYAFPYVPYFPYYTNYNGYYNGYNNWYNPLYGYRRGTSK